ncbi:TetR/AcrR family transcriptional regulator [Chitinilyticum piscinae]|uniref:TetR/AcrR family transcriptional regulator n=1 Tax=Chitinilyticum piscinae TaxID=2866724 RepID=A0A8J7FYH2_9NEIS|nr:TetR/AcrR family transcriptional regulator [Chitinilyticum piscinae]MBE9608018.1 TetR/AcrR family transcriptional regulator [Chitinilyticum piscinae]
MTSEKSCNEPCRAETRRNQVLCAAAQCFRQSGFHGASMANIARTAGMSVGHIYHYFENKEAIIAAIVAAEQEKTRALLELMISAENTIEAMIEFADKGLDEHLDSANVALQLEILAEVSRNPRVAEILSASDRALEDLGDQLLSKARSGLPPLPPDELGARIEAICALFQGLGLRGLTSQRLERNAVLAVLQRTIRQIVSS